MTTSTIRDPTCYRHADRIAAGRCQQCGRPICAECTTADRPEVSGCETVPTLEGPDVGIVLAAGRPYVALALIAVNALVAVVCLATDPQWLNGELSTLARQGAMVGGAVLVGRDGIEAVGVAHGEWYRMFTAAFLHFGPVHLGFNMLALWQAGQLLEARIGRLRFATIFFVGFLGGDLGALLLHPEGFAAGASGGVFGLFGALFLAERKGFFGRAGSSFGVLIAINLFLTFAIPGISVGGHIGGLLAGLAVSWVMFEYDSRGLPPTVPLGLSACLAAALFAGCLWAATLSADPVYGI